MTELQYELQYGLIGLGAAALVGIFAYNKWQERAHRKVAEKMLKSEHSDVLLGGDPPAQREEPVAAGGTAAAGERREPVIGGDFVPEPDISAPQFAPADAIPAKEAAEDLPPGAVPAALLDPRLDFIVVMELVEAVPATQILHSQREALMRIGKPVIWVGFNEHSRQWEAIAPDTALPYRRLRIGLQLADRRGPLSESDLGAFVLAMQNLADEMLAVADLPPTQPMLDQAVELDRFCADVDFEIGVNVVSRTQAFSGTKLRALAEAAGMVLGAGGQFTRYDDEGRAQFSLQNFENAPFTAESIKALSTRGLTFLIDVPRVENGERAFNQMLELARRFADTLQGNLVDDNRHPLTEAQLEHIRREFVAKPQAVMARYGLPAGGPQALRLFA